MNTAKTTKANNRKSESKYAEGYAVAERLLAAATFSNPVTVKAIRQHPDFVAARAPSSVANEVMRKHRNQLTLVRFDWPGPERNAYCLTTELDGLKQDEKEALLQEKGGAITKFVRTKNVERELAGKPIINSRSARAKAAEEEDALAEADSTESVELLSAAREQELADGPVAAEAPAIVEKVLVKPKALAAPQPAPSQQLVAMTPAQAVAPQPQENLPTGVNRISLKIGPVEINIDMSGPLQFSMGS